MRKDNQWRQWTLAKSLLVSILYVSIARSKTLCTIHSNSKLNAPPQIWKVIQISIRIRRACLCALFASLTRVHSRTFELVDHSTAAQNCQMQVQLPLDSLLPQASRVGATFVVFFSAYNDLRWRPDRYAAVPQESHTNNMYQRHEQIWTNSSPTFADSPTFWSANCSLKMRHWGSLVRFFEMGPAKCSQDL